MPLTQVQGGMLAGSTNTTTTIQSNGTTAITIDSSQKVGIGTTTPTTNLQVVGAGSGTFGAYNDPLNVKGSDYTLLYVNGTNGVAATIYNYNSSNGWYTGTNNSASYRIGYMSSINQTGVSNAKDGSAGITVDTSGNVGIGTTTMSGVFNVRGGGNCTYFTQTAAGGYVLQTDATINSGTYYFVNFLKAGVGISNITSNGTTISYGTGSDYRLKENINPMTGGLNKVMQLKPSTWNWQSFFGEGSSQGFVAHELQEIIPEAVTGKKDDVDEEGKPRYQNVDTSFIVATLTAAIQELNAKVEAQAAEIAALKAAP